jgi:AcrR family transcriptional regulator
MRNALWDAAIDLFARKGFDETTVDDIAEAAGVSRRSFFRYFASKNDLLAQGMVSYGAALTAAIEACPRTFSLGEIMREVVRQVAEGAAAQPQTRKIMEIAAKYPAARDAQITRVAEVQELVAEAFAKRGRTGSKNEMTAHVLAGLTLSILSVTFRTWFDHHQPNIVVTVDQVFETLQRLICGDGKNGTRPGVGKQKVKRSPTSKKDNP